MNLKYISGESYANGYKLVQNYKKLNTILKQRKHPKAAYSTENHLLTTTSDAQDEKKKFHQNEGNRFLEKNSHGKI